MCVLKTPKVAAPQVVAATDNREATLQGDLETRLRRRRAGAAGDVLTSAIGIPATGTLGGVAR